MNTILYYFVYYKTPIMLNNLKIAQESKLISLILFEVLYQVFARR